MKLKKTLAIVLAIAAVATISVTAFAAAGNSVPQANAAWGERLRDPFKSLLDGGVISQATYEKMKDYLEESMSQRTRLTERVNIMDELLEEGVITQAEYDAIRAAMPASKKGGVQRPESGERPQLANPFDTLVEDGTISEQTVAAIKEYLQENRPVRSEIKENLKDYADIFSKMLESNVITQAEYDAIKAAMPDRPILNKLRGRNADK